MVTEYDFSFGEMDEYQAGTENVGDEPGAACHTRKESAQRLLGLCLKDLGAIIKNNNYYFKIKK